MADTASVESVGELFNSTNETKSIGFNKDCKEFTPIVGSLGLIHTRTSKCDDEFSTMGSTLDELLAQAAAERRRESIDTVKGSVGTICPSPMPSTAQVTPQMSSVLLPPPPGYDAIMEPSECSPFSGYESSQYYDQTSMYSSPSWKSYPPPFHLGFKLFVGALPYSVCEADLFPLFNQFGEILELHVQRDWLGRSKGCAWLRYSTSEECDVAIEALHNNYYLGSMNRPMQLTYASEDKKPLRPRTNSYQSNGSLEILEPLPPVPTIRPRAMTDQDPPVNSILSKLRTMSQSVTSAAELDIPQVPAPRVSDGGECASKILQVSFFPADYSDAQIASLFSQFGSVESVSRRDAGGATVTFKFPRDAYRAKSTMDGVTLPGCDRPVKILVCVMA